MAIFFIEPFKKVGNISFNESRDAVRSKMGEYKEFRKNRFSKNTTDAFEGCHVFYTQEDKVEAVELFRDTIPVYNKKNLFLFSVDQVKKMMNDPQMIENGSYLSFPSYGIDISVSDGVIESVFVHSKEY